jgi:hypothetical protein
VSTRRVILAAALIAALAGAVTAFAQIGAYKPLSDLSQYRGNVRYDGRFVFIRMSYPWSNNRQVPYWSHDYPAGEYHFLKILAAVTNMSSHLDESSIMSFSDPELFKFPVAYICEPGPWSMSDTDVTNLRAYLRKGGFLIVDDFPREAWDNFDMQFSRVFPEGRWLALDETHPIFHSFFEINRLDNIPVPYNRGGAPMFYGMFEDNDPKKRMYAVANFQNDISEFWEWSDTGQYLVADSNEAYKIGVNEFLYGVTH